MGTSLSRMNDVGRQDGLRKEERRPPYTSGVERDLRLRVLRPSPAGSSVTRDERHAGSLVGSGRLGEPVSARFRTPLRAADREPLQAPAVGGRITTSALRRPHGRTYEKAQDSNLRQPSY